MDDVKKLTPEETVEALRHCVNEQHCMDCVMYPYLRGGKCTMKLCAAAADTIEELLAQKPTALIVPNVDLSEESQAMILEAMQTAAIMPVGAEPSIKVVQQGWVPVTERLPEEQEWLQPEEWLPVGERETESGEGRKHTSSELVIVAVRDDCDKQFVFNDITFDGEWVNYRFPEFEVTHWMPIPPAPGKEGA